MASCTALLAKANNAKFSCQFYILFCGRFERSGVQTSCRAPNYIVQSTYTKRVYLPTDVAVQVESLLIVLGWRCVSMETQRKVWTPLSKKSSKVEDWTITYCKSGVCGAGLNRNKE